MSVEPNVAFAAETLNKLIQAAVERHGSDVAAVVAEVRAAIGRLEPEKRELVEALFASSEGNFGAKCPNG